MLPLCHTLTQIQVADLWLIFGKSSRHCVSKIFPALYRSTELHCLCPFMDLLHRLNHPAGDAPPVSCIAADAAMFFTLDAAQELGITGMLFFTASACAFLGYAQYDRLVDLGLIPFKVMWEVWNAGIDSSSKHLSETLGCRVRKPSHSCAVIESHLNTR